MNAVAHTTARKGKATETHPLKLPALLLALTVAGLAGCGGADDATTEEGASAEQAAAGSRERAQAEGDVTWARVAGEWQRFTVAGTKTVRFGAGTKWITKQVTTSGTCTSAFFGLDPAVGVNKQCEVASTETAEPPPTDSGTGTGTGSWTAVAREWQAFSFTGTKTVRYGVNTSWVTKTVTGAGVCTNAFFGKDPARGLSKTCQVQDGTGTLPVQPADPDPDPTPTDPTPTGKSIPTPQSIAGKRVVGRIDAKSGQVIENVHVTNPNGPCIVIFQNITNVTIRNSEIGPCGDAVPTRTDSTGILILPGASNITIEQNVIHSVSNGVHAYQARHPIVFDRNYVYNVRGPFPAGQMLQLHSVRSGTGRSKVTCNISDATYGSGVRKAYEDHISMYQSSGTAENPIEIAYNRIRGGTSQSGSAMMLGDAGGDYQWSHHNTIVNVANAGIGVAGGRGHLVENNRIDNRGATSASLTHMAFSVRKIGADTCTNITLRNNRGIARLWAWGGRGETVDGYGTDNACSGVQLVNNSFGDTSVSPAMFDEPYEQCN